MRNRTRPGIWTAREHRAPTGGARGYSLRPGIRTTAGCRRSSNECVRDEAPHGLPPGQAQRYPASGPSDARAI